VIQNGKICDQFRWTTQRDVIFKDCGALSRSKIIARPSPPLPPTRMTELLVITQDGLYVLLYVAAFL